tara:strand:- start:119 stop:409 length:291 start_codon:yes stop_codon:yes gene_type:complete
MNRLLLNVRKKIMAFRDMFKDDNDINEKNVVGFAAFAVMVLFAIADIVTGWMGDPLHVNEFIYNSFLWITLGSFGIAEAGKIFGKSDNLGEDHENI